MGLGNNNTSGEKGRNYSFQKGVITLLKEMINRIRVTDETQVVSLVNGVSANVSNTVATDVLLAPTSPNVHYISSIVVTNGSNSVGTWVTFKGASSDTTYHKVFCSAGGGGVSINFGPTPIRMVVSEKLQIVCTTTAADIVANVTAYVGS